MGNGLAGGFAQGSAAATDYMFRRYAAELQGRQDARQQRQDDFGFEQAQKALAERERINAANAARQANFLGMGQQQPATQPGQPRYNEVQGQPSPQQLQAGQPFSMDPTTVQGAAPGLQQPAAQPAPPSGQVIPQVSGSPTGVDQAPLQVSMPDPNITANAPGAPGVQDAADARVLGQPGGGGGPVGGGMQPDLARGMSGMEVSNLQGMLVDAGLMTVDQVNTGPGIFGPQTQAALKQWQLAHGIPPTGVVGPATRIAMEQQGLDAQQQQQMAAATQMEVMPADAAAAAEAVEGSGVPEVVVAPREMNGPGVARAAEEYQQALAQQSNKVAAEREWRLNTYGQQIQALAAEHPSIGYAVNYGGVTIDIPSYNEAYKNYSETYQRMMVYNGDINAVESMAAANGWTVDGFDMDGNIKFKAQDAEQQLDHAFSMTRAQAEQLSSVMDIAEKNGGFLPSSYVQQNMEMLLHFPKLFRWRQDAAGNMTQQMQVDDERGFPVSQDFFASVEARRNAVSTASGMTRQAQVILRQREFELKVQREDANYRGQFERRLKQFADSADMPDSVLDRMVAEWNERYPDEPHTRESMGETIGALVVTPQERAAIQTKRDENLARIRQNGQAALTELRARLRPARGGGGGRRVSTGNTAADRVQRAADVETVAVQANAIWDNLQQYRTPGWTSAMGEEYRYTGLPDNLKAFANSTELRNFRSAWEHGDRFSPRAAALADSAADVLSRHGVMGLGRGTGNAPDEVTRPLRLTPPADSGRSAAPPVGQVRGGYRFKGGNPADRNNWERV